MGASASGGDADAMTGATGGGTGAGGAGGAGGWIAGGGEPGQPTLRWSSRVRSVEAVQEELARIWSSITLAMPGDDGEERRVAARSSVMNLVVIARRGETAEHAAAVIHGLMGRHPSRTIIATSADPDGPSWIDAQVQAHCVLPSRDSPETCAELIFLTAGGDAGQHLAGCVGPLLVHDLPVTVWWPSEPRFDTPGARSLLRLADRVVVDGAGWSGDGLDRLAALAALPARHDVQVADFALLRQSRWREAIASSFDLPRLRPFLGWIRELSVGYAARDGTPRLTNVVKPIYHLAWLASRLGMVVLEPLEAGDGPWSGYRGTVRVGRRRVAVDLRPIESGASPGTTEEVTLVARRGSQTLEARVTGQADGITVATTVDGRPMSDRHYLVPRRREGDLLAETIEDGGAGPLTSDALAMAAALVGGSGGPGR
ncbi:MAG TPA: glucose-6-phosphate dehydrogenase assembly protein OpcA [Candidatus Limnocylindrales bacterium]|nr:glucose-6-phosphate dehydrogenase assembly protein OpcA [Candidatus Limnocylindrales bacterium]